MATTTFAPQATDLPRPDAAPATPLLARIPKAWRPSLVGGAVLFCATVAYSAYQWHLGGQGADMADFNQAAWLIVHGHPNPVMTAVTTTPPSTFLDDHFSLFFYPLCLVYALHQSGFTLMVLQDLATALAVTVLTTWLVEMARAHRAQASPALPRPFLVALVAGGFVMAAANPWLWQSISFDFHMDAFVTLFVVLAARAFWHRRPVTGLVWCAVALTCIDYAGLIVCGLGLCVVAAGSGIRRWGFVAMALGLGWVFFVSAIGTNHGDHVTAYSYLVGPHATAAQTGLVGIAVGATLHPSRWYSVLATKPLILYQLLVPAGLLSLVSPWSFAVVLAALVPPALLPAAIFLDSGFQTIVAEVVGVAGAFFVLLWLGAVLGRRFGARAAQVVVGVVALAVFAQFVGVAAVLVPRVPSFWLRDTAAQAAALGAAAHEIPTSAELVVSMPVMGHFTDRLWVEPLIEPGQSFPVAEREVYFLVAPSAGIISMIPALSEEAIARAEALGARVVSSEHGVTVLSWHPAPTVKTFQLLPASGP